MHVLKRPPPTNSRSAPAFHKTLKDGFEKPLYCLVGASPTANQSRPRLAPQFVPIKAKAGDSMGLFG
ncbi:hypothetical protein C7I87_26980 [Mesorhizobium sp. SARCC-RB16n]|nr:hypothetical protein C7I87_26980 [Mesorhizobium sp. SARCC-RB16n]